MTRSSKQDLERRLNEIDARTTRMIQETRSRLTSANDTQLTEIEQVVTQLEQAQQVTSGGGTSGGGFGTSQR